MIGRGTSEHGAAIPPVEEQSEAGTRLLPAHFPTPTVGRIRRHKSAYRFDFEE